MVKTLIFNGSPRRNGNTSVLIRYLTERLKGDCKIVEAYHCGISPCVDCRFCRKNKGCCIEDEMQEVYTYIEECDNILIASPVYFSELTGAMLNVASRLQTYFSARSFRGEQGAEKNKKGAVLLVGGGNGACDTALKTAGILLKIMGADEVFPAVCSLNTDKIHAIDDKKALEGLCSIAEYFNENKD